MDLKLAGKSALVTGSTLGIGYAIAKRLADEGAQVIINGRNETRCREAAERLARAVPSAQIRTVAADLSTPEGATRMIEAVPQVDILINNVGIFEPKAFEDITDDDWLYMFQVNVMSGVRLCRHYFPKMKAADWGRIIFISSESGLNIPAEMVHYGMTKTAQISIARGLARLSAKTGVTVNSVLPGPTMSEGVEVFVNKLAEEQGLSASEMEQDFFENVRPTSLLGRFEKPEEIADLVAFVASPLSSATNGAALRAEGGIVNSLA